MTQPNAKLVEVARAIARGLGDDYDHAFANKSEWNAARGEKGGRFRDINEPRQCDYLDAATEAIRALMEPSEDMVQDGRYCMPFNGEEDEDADLKLIAENCYRAMLAKVLEEEG